MKNSPLAFRTCFILICHLVVLDMFENVAKGSGLSTFRDKCVEV